MDCFLYCRSNQIRLMLLFQTTLEVIHVEFERRSYRITHYLFSFVEMIQEIDTDVLVAGLSSCFPSVSLRQYGIADFTSHVYNRHYLTSGLSLFFTAKLKQSTRVDHLQQKWTCIG